MTSGFAKTLRMPLRSAELPIFKRVWPQDSSEVGTQAVQRHSLPEFGHM